jgi:hypothetical protein
VVAWRGECQSGVNRERARAHRVPSHVLWSEFAPSLLSREESQREAREGASIPQRQRFGLGSSPYSGAAWSTLLGSPPHHIWRAAHWLTGRHTGSRVRPLARGEGASCAPCGGTLVLLLKKGGKRTLSPRQPRHHRAPLVQACRGRLALLGASAHRGTGKRHVLHRRRRCRLPLLLHMQLLLQGRLPRGMLLRRPAEGASTAACAARTHSERCPNAELPPGPAAQARAAAAATAATAAAVPGTTATLYEVPCRAAADARCCQDQAHCKANGARHRAVVAAWRPRRVLRGRGARPWGEAGG